MNFKNVISLGYNCEVSYRIEDLLGRKIDSYPFSWAYVMDNHAFLKCLENLEDVLENEIEILPSGMFKDKK